MNSKPITVYQCEKCKKAYADKNLADICCEQKFCKTCNEPLEYSYRIYCTKCELDNIYRRGIKIPYSDYKEKMFFCEHNDKYYSDYGDLIEDYLEEYDESDCVSEDEFIEKYVPKWAVGCEEVHFKINIDHAIESAEEEMYEDFDDVVDKDELYEFVEKWNAKQTGCSYHPDYKTIIEF